MPKAKKQTLTRDELLEQALVPEHKQPYEVPRNWIWVVLGETVRIKRGASPRPIKRFVTDDIDGVNWIKIGDTGEGKYVCSVKERITKQGAEASVFVESGTLLLSNSMSFGRPYILAVDGCIHDGWLSITVSDCFDKDYMYYALLSSNWYFEQVAVGTAVRNLNSERVAGLPCPLPPPAEQYRIVERIESLFDKLDRAKELAQSALDSFENRNATILHKAFTGELTAKWRKENEVGLESWQKKLLKDIARVRSGYAFDSKTFINAGYQVIRMGNLYNGVLDLTRSPVFISEDSVDEAILKKFMASKGDILLTLTGTKYKRDYGYAVLIEHDAGLLVNQRIMAITPESIEQNLLLYYLRSNFFRDIFFSNETGGVNQGNVSSTFTTNIPVPYPTLPEQQEIVRILDSLLDKEQRARELCDVIDKIDLMKKAILARAFRGELGTNDPAEENAVGLLGKSL